MRPQAASRLKQLIDGYRVSQLVCVAAELGIADLVRQGVRSPESLAEHISANPHALRRFLRALCALGIFDRVDADGLALNEMSALLLDAAPRSLKPWAYATTEQWYAPWGALRHAVMTGEPAFDRVFGMDAWSYRQRNAGSGEVFDRAMAALVTDMSDAVIAAYDFSRFKLVVDVGGGSGGLMAAMLRAHPALRGIVFDSIAKADALVPFGSRASAVRGSFFEAIPPGADCYVLSRVLHDWEDEDAVRILRNVAAAMPDTGTLVVIDRVLADDAADAEASISDLNMMVMNGGRERSGAEFRRLIEQAGLRMSRIFGTGCFASVIEARSAKAG